MNNETNRFTRHPKCEKCGFPYGFHVCLPKEVLALDETKPAPIEKPKAKRTFRGEMTEERREKIGEASRKMWDDRLKSTPNRNAEIARLYDEDWWTIRELEEKYKISKGTVIRILENEGVAVRPRGLTRETYILRTNIDEIKKDYIDKKMSLREVGKKWDVSQRTVGRALKEAGVKLRPATRRPKYTFN